MSTSEPSGVEPPAFETGADETGLLTATLKQVAGALREAGVRFALTGSFAAYARGGALSEHDVDFLVHGSDVEKALRTLEDRGMRVEDVPEDWLAKAFDDDRMVDLIYRPVRHPVTDALLADSDELQVGGAYMPVISATVLMIHKLLAFSHQYCDFATALPLARALREQIDWKRVGAETAASPYAAAFLFLSHRLGLTEIVPGPTAPDAQDAADAAEEE